MKRILIGAALAAFVFGPAYAQSSTTMGDTTCLKTVLVDHTEVKDASTIIFTMKDGAVWKNTLKNPAPRCRTTAISIRRRCRTTSAAICR